MVFFPWAVWNTVLIWSLWLLSEMPSAAKRCSHYNYYSCNAWVLKKQWCNPMCFIQTKDHHGVSKQHRNAISSFYIGALQKQLCTVFTFSYSSKYLWSNKKLFDPIQSKVPYCTDYQYHHIYLQWNCMFPLREVTKISEWFMVTFG